MECDFFALGVLYNNRGGIAALVAPHIQCKRGVLKCRFRRIPHQIIPQAFCSTFPLLPIVLMVLANMNIAALVVSAPKRYLSIFLGTCGINHDFTKSNVAFSYDNRIQLR